MPLAADVLLPLPLPAFTFLVPFGAEAGPVGGRVVVPWQGTLRIGICTGVKEVGLSQSLDLRELVNWLDDGPFFTPGALELFAELAATSANPAGSVLATFALTGLDQPLLHEVRLQRATDLAAGFEPDSWHPVTAFEPARLEQLRREGLIFERAGILPRLESQLVATVTDTSALPAGKSADKQRQALEKLLEGPAESAASLARDAGVSASSVRTLIGKGLASYREIAAPAPALPLPDAAALLPAASLELPTEASFNLTGGLRRQRLAELLPLLEQETRRGLSPVLIAPEVVWLAEAVSALRTELDVLMFTGELTDAQREHTWQRASQEKGLLLAGTWPALLLNPPAAGSVIVLDSASSSWKMLSGARLFIPHAARLLAGIEKRRIIETEVMDNAELRATGQELVRLPLVEQRIHVTDMNSASGWPLDADLSRVLRQVMDRGRQAVLLSSRRGFSGALSCSACGHTIGCPNCDLPLRYHQKENSLRCHQCNHTAAVPDSCPECGDSDMQPGRSAGTQWLASAVRTLVGDFPVHRLDRDVKLDPEELLAGEPGVLIATTAALRLPPLPNVSLIGVSLFDAHLNQGDFRAGENTLRLMLQLPELTTRERPLVLVQSFQPEHPVLGVLSSEDVTAAAEAFTDTTVLRREAFGYPPFAQLARIEITARDRATAEREARRLHGSMLALGAQEADLLGPVPAGVARLRGRYVWQLLVRSADRDQFRELLASVPGSQQGARFRVDVDPRDVSLELD